MSFYAREANDTRGLKALPLNLPASSSIYCDAGYTDYRAEDECQENDGIFLKVFPKSIHAVTMDGFLLKVAGFIVVFTIESAFIV